MELIMENTNYSEEKLRELVRVRVKKMRSFYIKLFIYAIALAVFIAKTFTNLPLHFFPVNYLSETVILIWSFIIALETLSFFMRESVFGVKWEQEKIKKILDSEKIEKKTWN